MTVQPIRLVCEFCGSAFEMKPWVFRHREKFNGKVRFCSRPCFTHFRRLFERGDASPLWKGGELTSRGRGWLEYRLTIVEKQDGHCARCGRQCGKSLHVHHKRAFELFATEEEANHPDNLEGLCARCHSKHHREQDRAAGHYAITHCSKGHEFTPQNTHVTKEGWQRCRACTNERQRLYQKALRAARGPKVRVYVQKTHCDHGHPMSGENLMINPSGRRRCRICVRRTNARSK